MKEDFISYKATGFHFAGFCGHSCSYGNDTRLLVTLFGSKLHGSWQHTRNGLGLIWTNDLEMGNIIFFVKDLSETWKYSPTFCQKAQELWSKKSSVLLVTQCQLSTASMFQWCFATSCPFFPNLKLLAGSAASQIWSMLFCLCVSLWVPRCTSCLRWPWPWLQWELLPLTDSSSWTHPTACAVSFEVWEHRDTHRLHSETLSVVAVDGWGWVLCSTRSTGKGGMLHSKGGNRNTRVLWGKGGEKAKHLGNSSKAARTGEGRRFRGDTHTVVERIFAFNKE